MGRGHRRVEPDRHDPRPRRRSCRRPTTPAPGCSSTPSTCAAPSHRRRALGCDALVTSPYKWYGPHAGVLCADPAVLAELPVAKVRPAPDRGTAALGDRHAELRGASPPSMRPPDSCSTRASTACRRRGGGLRPAARGPAADRRRARVGPADDWTVARRRSPSPSTAAPRAVSPQRWRPSASPPGPALLRRRGRRPARPRRSGGVVRAGVVAYIDPTTSPAYARACASRSGDRASGSDPGARSGSDRGARLPTARRCGPGRRRRAWG